MEGLSNKNILIIGGNGFVGSHLVDASLQLGLNVRVLDISPERFRQPNLEVDYRLGNISDEAFLLSALENIDTVVHLVSTTVPGTSNLDCVYDVESNLVPSIKLLNAMVKKSCRKIIYFSSGGTVYGNTEVVPIPEETILHPICSYGVVKAAIENYILMYEKLYEIKSLIIRPANLYGNRHGNTGVQGLINTLIERIANNQDITIWGSGTNVRDYIYIEDIVELFRVALQMNAEGIYNAGSGIGYSVNDIIKIIESTIGIEAKINHTPARSFDVESMILDIAKAQKHLGWQCTTTIEQGIQYMWNNRIKQ